jgi:hypothetical protein
MTFLIDALAVLGIAGAFVLVPILTWWRYAYELPWTSWRNWKAREALREEWIRRAEAMRKAGRR